MSTATSAASLALVSSREKVQRKEDICAYPPSRGWAPEAGGVAEVRRVARLESGRGGPWYDVTSRCGCDINLSAHFNLFYLDRRIDVSNS